MMKVNELQAQRSQVEMMCLTAWRRREEYRKSINDLRNQLDSLQEQERLADSDFAGLCSRVFELSNQILMERN